MLFLRNQFIRKLALLKIKKLLNYKKFCLFEISNFLYKKQNNLMVILIIRCLVVSATRKRHEITVVSAGLSAEKFNIASNDHGRTQKCDFSVLDRKCPLEQIWCKKSELSVQAEIWYLN